MRARNLKPKLFKNELLGSADPLITILFEGLWCSADREGRLEDRPLRLCAEVFPYRRAVTEKKVDGWLDWLHENNFIARYEVDGLRFIQVLTFLKHNRPHSKEQPSEIPPLSASQHLPRLVPAPTKVGAREQKGSGEHALNPESPFLNPESSLRERERAPEVGPEPESAETDGDPSRARLPSNAEPGPVDHGTALTQQTADDCLMWREVEGIVAAEFERFIEFVTRHPTKRKPYSEAARYQLAKDLVGWARGNADTQRLIVNQSIRADHVVLYPLKDLPASQKPGRMSFDDMVAARRAAGSEA